MHGLHMVGTRMRALRGEIAARATPTPLPTRSHSARFRRPGIQGPPRAAARRRPVGRGTGRPSVHPAMPPSPPRPGGGAAAVSCASRVPIRDAADPPWRRRRRDRVPPWRGRGKGGAQAARRSRGPAAMPALFPLPPSSLPPSLPPSLPLSIHPLPDAGGAQAARRSRGPAAMPVPYTRPCAGARSPNPAACWRHASAGGPCPGPQAPAHRAKPGAGAARRGGRAQPRTRVFT